MVLCDSACVKIFFFLFVIQLFFYGLLLSKLIYAASQEVHSD